MIDFARDDISMTFDNGWTAKKATDHIAGKKRVYDNRFYVFDNNDVVRFGISIDKNGKIDEISRGNESYLKKHNLNRMDDDTLRNLVSEYMKKTNTGVNDDVKLMNADKFIANKDSSLHSLSQIPENVSVIRLSGTFIDDFMDIPESVKELSLKGNNVNRLNIGKNIETLNIEHKKLEKLAKEGKFYLNPESSIEMPKDIKRAGNKAWERQFGNREDMFSRIKSLLKSNKKEEKKENKTTTNAPSQNQPSSRRGAEM